MCALASRHGISFDGAPEDAWVNAGALRFVEEVARVLVPGGGAVLTETTFSLPGIGKFAYDAIQSQDLPEVMGVTLLAALFVIIANLVVDVLYAVVDPRVRLS